LPVEQTKPNLTMPWLRIREAKASDAEHLVRFINMAADDLPRHFWRKSVGSVRDPWDYGRERAARETGNFSFRNAWLASATATFALNAGRWFRRGRLVMVISSLAASCRCCAENPLVPVVQISAASSMNAYWFLTLADAAEKLEARRRDYNEERPHGAIGNKAPITLTKSGEITSLSP